jgi:hypothetical protein
MLTLLRLPYSPVSGLANGFTLFSPYAVSIAALALRCGADGVRACAVSGKHDEQAQVKSAG